MQPSAAPAVQLYLHALRCHALNLCAAVEFESPKALATENMSCYVVGIVSTRIQSHILRTAVLLLWVL